jgi:hypothetical protein
MPLEWFKCINEINDVTVNVFVFNIANLANVCRTVIVSFYKLHQIAENTTNKNLKSVLGNLQRFIEDFLNLSITFQGTSNSYTTSIEEIIDNKEDIINFYQTWYWLWCLIIETTWKYYSY